MIAMVIHEFSVDASHAQPADVVMVMLELPPAAETVVFSGLNVYMHEVP